MSTMNNFFESASYKDGIFKGLLPEYYPPKYQQYISEETALLKEKTKGAKRILEAGVGLGRLIPELAPQVQEFIGIDNAQFMLVKAREVARAYSNVKILDQDIENLSQLYPKEYFDYSLCVWNTFGNLHDKAVALKALAAVTKNSIFITVFLKGTVKDRLELYKNIEVEILKQDPETETFYLKGYVSKTFNVQDFEKLAAAVGLIVKEHRILGGVILYVELCKK